MAAVGSLAGHALAHDKALATLPTTLQVVGTALATIPASLLMKRVGRRLGFIVGGACAMVGGLIAAAGVATGRFWLLALGTGIFALYGGVVQQYRFAAAETSAAESRSRAISLVLAGGLAAGFVGPQLAKWTKDLASPVFLGSYLCVPLLGAAAVILLLGLRMPARPPEEVRPTIAARPIATIVRQPIFIVAVVAQMMGQGVMNLLMTGTPLAMMAHHHGFAETAFVIQWHVVGMFLPGFWTGDLVRRWGERTVILLGIAINALSIVAGFTGNAVLNFWLALTLNGVGWNFMFVAGSTLVTKAYEPAERAKTQAANDFLVYGTAAVTSLSAGQLLHRQGWQIVLATAVVMLLAALAGTVWRLREKVHAVPSPR